MAIILIMISENTFTATNAPTQNRPTARLQSPTKRRLGQTPIIGTTTAMSACLANRFAAVRTRFQFAVHRANRAMVRSRVTDIGYYIRNRYEMCLTTVTGGRCYN